MRGAHKTGFPVSVTIGVVLKNLRDRCHHDPMLPSKRRAMTWRAGTTSLTRRVIDALLIRCLAGSHAAMTHEG
jgi:hypothetical protein